MQPNQKFARPIRAPQRFDEEFHPRSRRRQRKTYGRSNRSSLSIDSRSPLPRYKPPVRRGKTRTDISKVVEADAVRLCAAARAYRMANNSWYGAQKHDLAKHSRTPSPSRAMDTTFSSQRSSLFDVTMWYVLPRVERRPPWEPDDEQTIPSAYIQARESNERNLRDDVVADNNAQAQYHREGYAMMRRLETKRERSGLHTGFIALHPSLQVAIITEILEDASHERLIFYDANAERTSDTGSWLGFAMDRTFLPSEQHLIETSTADGGASSSTFRQQDPTDPFLLEGGRQDSLEALISECIRPSTPSMSRRPPPPTSYGQATALQRPHEISLEQWPGVEGHNPNAEGQQYYPADQLFGLLGAQVESILAGHQRDYRDKPEMAPTGEDVARALDFLGKYELPREWVSMWLATDEQC